jgi:hypothetical protein
VHLQTVKHHSKLVILAPNLLCLILESTASIKMATSGGAPSHVASCHDYEGATVALATRHAYLQHHAHGRASTLRHVVTDDPYLPLDFPQYDNVNADKENQRVSCGWAEVTGSDRK